VLRRWSVTPEEFLRVQDLLAAAEVPGTLTFVALDAEGLIVAVLQTAPEGSERAGMRSVALLVHPGARRAGFGRATLFAALDEPCYAGSVLFAAIDCQNSVSLRCFAACGFVADGGAVAKGYPEFVRRVPARTAAYGHHRGGAAKHGLPA